jgi:preprotein translocase subunit SecE
MNSIPSWITTLIVIVVVIFLLVWAAGQLGIHF